MPSYPGSRSGWSSHTPSPPRHNSGGGLYWISQSIKFLGAYKLQDFSFKSLRARDGGRRMLQKELREVTRSKEQCCHISYFLFQNHVLGEQQLKTWSVMKMSTSPWAGGLKGIRHHLKETSLWWTSLSEETHTQENKTKNPSPWTILSQISHGCPCLQCSENIISY